MSFGNRLREARKKAGLTQRDIAEILKTTPQNYAQYERGIRNPKKETLTKIANVLNVGFAYTKDGEPYFYNKTRPGFEREVVGGVEIERFNPDVVEDINRKTLLEFYDKMNESGKKEASKRICEMSRLPEYTETIQECDRKENNVEDTVMSVRKATQKDFDTF